MARLREGEKSVKTRQVKQLLHQHDFGIRESEIAGELGWDRRTVNNYLRQLEELGQVYKDRWSWFVED